MKPAISVVIPAHNESRGVLKKSLEMLQQRLTDYEYEVVIVENGSAELEDIPGTRYYQVEPAGLGLALKYGILKANNENVFYLPADMSYDLSFVDFAMQEEADLVIGSKKVKGSVVDRPITGKMASFLYTIWVRLGKGVHVKDVTGVKRYRRTRLLPLVLQCVSPGIGFEVELVLKMEKAGLQIKEIPVVVHDREKRGVLRWVQ